MKKVVVFGGGTGMSTLLKGLKLFPLDITAVVAVSDNGGSSGKLSKEFNIPAIGDIRQVLVALSETGSVIEDLFQYRYKSNTDLDGHPVGNLILTALVDITGKTSKAIESLDEILNIKGKILPLTEELVTLVATTSEGEIIEGEHQITKAGKKIKSIKYKNTPVVVPEVIDEIYKADLLVLSMGSLYTSLLPHFLIPEIKKALKNTKAKKIYISNIMTQHGETDNFKVSDCVKAINKAANSDIVDVVIANNQEIPDKTLLERYKKDDNSEPIEIDEEELEKMNIRIIKEDVVRIEREKNFKQNNKETNMIRHDHMKVAFAIFSYLME